MPEMQFSTIPRLSKKVSRIFLGTGGHSFTKGMNMDALLDDVYALGVNAFDTARVYGLSEKVLGTWIAERGLQKEVVVLSKGGHPSLMGRKRINEIEIRKDIEKSRENLQMDCIDIYLLHRDDPQVEAGAIVEMLNTLHTEGKICAFGVSNWSHRRIEAANEYAYKNGLVPFTVSSPNFGLAEQICDLWGGGCVSISGPGQKEAREWYQKNQMPIVAYSSLGRGLFSGRVRSDNPKSISAGMDRVSIKGYGSPDNFERLRRCELLAVKKGCSVAQIAMAWVYQQQLNVFAVVGCSSAERMSENVDALHISLTQQELDYLDLRTEM